MVRAFLSEYLMNSEPNIEMIMLLCSVAYWLLWFLSGSCISASKV